MTERQIDMAMSQAFMQEAVQYYLKNVMFKEELQVDEVQVDAADRKLNQTDHFTVKIRFPGENNG